MCLCALVCAIPEKSVNVCISVCARVTLLSGHAALAHGASRVSFVPKAGLDCGFLPSFA